MAAKPKPSLAARVTLRAPDGAVADAELHRIGLRAAAHTVPAGTPWLRTLTSLPEGVAANDGGRTLTVHHADTGELIGFTVFNSDDRLVELVLGDQMTVAGDAFVELEEWTAHRRDAGDPIGAGAAAPGDEPLMYWSYQPYEPASDGTCTTLVTDRANSQALVVITEDGALVDGLWVDPLLGGRADLSWVGELTSFRERRAAAGDPMFANHAAAA
jgi:hypothetical protein